MEKMRELSAPKIGIFGAYIAADWIGIAAGFALYAAVPSVLSFLAASVILGHFQHALVVLGHDAVHYRICKNRTLNDWIGNLFCYFPIGITVSSYREFHFPHHRDTFGKSDPEIPLRIALGRSFSPPFTISRGLSLWALSFVGHSLKEVAVFTSMLPIGKKMEKIYLLVYFTAASYLAYHFHALAFLGLWSFSLVSTYISMLRIQGWYEHGLSTMLTNRYSLPNWAFRLMFPHNVWLHYEHHKYPSVPFYNLEKARALDNSDKIYSLEEMIEGMADLNLQSYADSSRNQNAA